MSLLSIVQDAVAVCGLRVPSTVYTSTDPVAQSFMALSQVEGDALSRMGDWRGLKVIAQLTGDGSSTDFELPADFDRFVSGYPFWIDGENTLPLSMVSDEQMLSMKAADIDPIRPVWRLFGDAVEFHPAPDDAQIVNLEYRTSYWVVNSDETTRSSRWTADTDFAAIPERLIMLGTVWRYKASKGFTYDEDFRTYQVECAKALATQNGRQPIIMRAEFVGDYADAPRSEPRVIV